MIFVYLCSFITSTTKKTIIMIKVKTKLIGKIKFFEQTGGPQGIAHVVKCAEEFIGNESFMFLLSDNIFLGIW